MNMLLTVASFKGKPLNTPLKLVLNQQGATIGRGSFNTLILKDETVSREHARILYWNANYWIVDTSSNGVFINHSDHSLGAGSRTHLEDGNFIRIGGYELQVSLCMPKEKLPPAAFPDQSAKASIKPVGQAEWELAGIKQVDPVPDALSEKGTEGDFGDQPQHPDAGKNLKKPKRLRKAKPSASPGHCSSSRDELISQFLRGAELNGPASDQFLTPEAFHAFGAMVRLTVNGLIDVLGARKQLQIGMEMADITSIEPSTSQPNRAVKRNPLKFEYDEYSALAHMLNNKQGYMSAEQAVEEAFDDIRWHQIAMMAGTEEAVKALLQRFDPDSLAHRLERDSPIKSSIPFHRKGMLWEQFEKLYSEIESEAKEDFDNLFREAFVEAYEACSRFLKQEQH